MKQFILIAEDNSDEAEMLVDMLKRSGLTAPLHVVSDGEELLAYLKGEGAFADRKLYPLPGVMFLDMVMRKKGGLEVLTWIQGQTELKIRVIVVTGFLNVNQMELAYRLGAHAFLTKPFLEHEVSSFVRRLNMPQS